MYKGLLAFVLLTGVYSFGQSLKVTTSGGSDLFTIDNIIKITFNNDEMIIGGTNKKYSISDITKVNFTDQPTKIIKKEKSHLEIYKTISRRIIKNSFLVDIPEGYQVNPEISFLNIQGKLIQKKTYSGKLSSVKCSFLPVGLYVLEVRSLNKVIHSNIVISK